MVINIITDLVDSDADGIITEGGGGGGLSNGVKHVIDSSPASRRGPSRRP